MSGTNNLTSATLTTGSGNTLLAAGTYKVCFSDDDVSSGNWADTGFTVDVNASRRMRERLCAPSLPRGDPEGLCDGRIARVTLLQFSFFGLLEERCLTEKLFEAQFGLRFGKRTGLAAGAHQGKGAHAVAKLRFESLSGEQQLRVRWLNRNDLLLYAEAKLIFRERLRMFGIADDVRCD